jgi:MerR family transcriptional regulator, heat shock protein HspR
MKVVVDMPEKDEPIYVISVAARLCELHPQTLRMYERMGLVRPRRISGKNRMYSESDIERLRQIQRLRQEMGVNLPGIEVILDLLEKMRRMQRAMDEMDGEIEQFRREMEKRFNGETR